MPKFQSFYALSASGKQMARKVHYCNYKYNLGNLLECTGLIPPPIPPPEPTPTPPTKKIILITGTNSGIGKALTFRLSATDSSYNVIAGVKEYRDIESLQRCATAAGITIYKIIKLDITNQEDIDYAVANFSIDILFNNAGVFHSFPAVTHPKEDFEYHSYVNYFGTYALTQGFSQKMITETRAGTRTQGQICFMSSIAGIVGFSTAAAYSASKFAIESMAQATYNEYKQGMYNIPDQPKINIIINAFVPDLYDTGFDNAATDYFLQNAYKNDGYANYATFMEYRDLYTQNAEPVYKIVDLIEETLNSGTPQYRICTQATTKYIKQLQEDVWTWS